MSLSSWVLLRKARVSELVATMALRLSVSSLIYSEADTSWLRSLEALSLLLLFR